MKTTMLQQTCLALFLLVSSLTGAVKAQEVQTNGDSTVSDPPFILSEIPTRFTQLSKYMVDVSKIIKLEKKIIKNDSIVREYMIAFEIEKEELTSTLPSLAYQRLEGLIRAWYNYKNKFDGYQETLVSRIQEIQSVENELEKELQIWETISKELNKEDIAEEFQQTADSAVSTLASILSDIYETEDVLFLMQNRSIKINLLIEDIIRMLEEAQEDFQSSYFILDSKPIWSSSDSAIQVQNVQAHFKTEITESYNNVKIYLRSNGAIVVLQIIFIFLLITGFLLLNKVWPTETLDYKSKREAQAGFVIRHPIVSSLLIGIVISAFFYSNRPPVLGGFFVMLMMISSLVLLPAFLTSRLRFPLLMLLILFILNFLQDFIPYQSFLNRMLLFFQSIAILFLIFFTFTNTKSLEVKPKGKRIFNTVLIIFGLLMIVAFLCNVIGSTKLSDFLISSTIRSLTFGVTVITIAIMVNSMMILIIKGKKAQSIPLYEQLKKLIDKRIKPVINWGGLILWGFGAIVYFRLLKPVQDLISRILDVEFVIATVAISIGGIISFALIVVFTYLIVRFIKNLFKDELIVKSSLPRGTADAASMLIRYIIVAFGIYLALGALGVSMSKFGFIAGALGVGIGFGLQNVVLNFIAGLILSFERPIHVGDIIEIDQFIGTVTEIGVRASKVLTWDGSEVIVPNGLLISNKVVNWTRTNQKRRLKISIKTPIHSDPESIIKILENVTREHPNTLVSPAPMVLFNGYESSFFDFTIFCWVDFNVSLRTKSELSVNAIRALNRAGVETPLPTQKLKIEDYIGDRENNNSPIEQ